MSKSIFGYISRKIILKGDLTDPNQIVLKKNVIELPFYMFESIEFEPNTEKTKRLSKLLPSNKKLFSLMTQERDKPSRGRGEVRNKIFNEGDFNKIKEWLENDHSKNSND